MMRQFNAPRRQFLADCVRVFTLLPLLVGGLQGSSILDLRVPPLEFEDATVKDALRKVAEFGVLVGFEEVCSDQAEKRFSLHLENVPLREVMDAIVSLDRRYRWRAYHPGRGQRGVGGHLVVNIAPKEAWEDESRPMNLMVESGTISQVAPSAAIAEISVRIPELRQYLYPGSGGVTGSTLSGIGPNVRRDEIHFEFVDLNIREILNEISLRSGVHGWVCECMGPNEKLSWRVFP